MTGQRQAWPTLDATLRRIDAALAEPELGSASTAWRTWDLVRERAEAGARRPPSPWEFVRTATDRPLADGGLIVASPAGVVTVPPRTYTAPPPDTRPGFLGRLRRRLFGEPPQ